MKWLCTLMAFMVLILSVQPVCASVSAADTCCSAGADCEKSTQHDDEHDDCKTSCNPFQVCGCCAFGIITPYQLTFIPSTQIIIPDVSWGTLKVAATDEPVSGFWQPPRLV